MTIEQTEKSKYHEAWTHHYKPSQCAPWLAEYVKKTRGDCAKFLDIGCGDGMTTYLMRSAGVDTHGVDITLVGLTGQKEGFHEAPVWSMPFADGEFDYTFSTDVMEHIPTEKVEAAIKEIYRVTRKKTFHCIATFEDSYRGVKVHMTVQPIAWWKEQFEKHRPPGVEVVVIDRTDFLPAMREGRL